MTPSRSIRSLHDYDVQIDIVPRLFEIVGPSVGIHTVEGLPLVGLSPAQLSRSSRCSSAASTSSVASLGLIVTARSSLSSPGESSATRPARSSSGRRGSA